METNRDLKVSLIVPVHNASNTLARCIKSILEQNYDNIECIIIENGSTDKSFEICKQFEAKYEFIKVFRSEKQGVSAARNLGLKKASGDIIGFCDADDYLMHNALRIVTNEFQRDSKLAGVIGAFYIEHGSRASVVEREYRGLHAKKLSAKEALVLTICSDSVMGSVWNKYYRIAALSESTFDISLTYCEDMHFNARVLSNQKNNIKLIEQPLYCYVDNYQSITHQTENIFDDNDELKYIVALKKILEDCHIDKEIVEQVKMKIACFAIDTIVNIEIDERKKSILRLYLKRNFWYLLKNVYRYNWKWNLKRLIQGTIILLLN